MTSPSARRTIAGKARGGSRAALSVALALVAVAARGFAAPAGDARRDASASLPRLETEAARSPHSVAAQRRLGVALFAHGDAERAVGHLTIAREASPRDRVTLYFLGRAAESAGHDSLALDAYRALLARGGRLAPVRARVDSLARRRAGVLAREAIAHERRLSVEAIPANTIAVPDFSMPVASDSLVPLSRGLAVVFLTDLSKVPSLQVVERARLGVLLDEIDRGRSARAGIAPGSAAHVGKLVGARRFAQGHLVPIGRGQVQLGASIIEVSDGSVRAAGEPASGALPRVLEMERTLLYQALDTLHVPVDAALRRRIGPLPTRSFPAFLAFSRGLDLEARGLTDEARREYAIALRLDSRFALAQERADVLAADASAAAALEAAMFAAAAEAGGDDRLLRGAAMAGIDGGPDASARGTVADSRMSAAQRVGFRNIPITVRFP